MVHMSMGDITNNRDAGVAAMHLSRILPPRLGYRLADQVANRLADNPETPIVKGIQLNQWIVNHCSLSPDQLKGIVREVMQNIARSLYDQFHYSSRSEKLDRIIDKSDRVMDLYSRRHSKVGGVVICGLHMSSFDLAYLALTSMGLKSIGLTLPEANETITWQHELRRQAGLEILPATMPNLRQVIRRLQDGEIVVTGIDRPLAHSHIHPVFFNYPSNLPLHHIQLALAANVPIILMSAIRREDGRFEILSTDYLSLKKYSDRKNELKSNGEYLLEFAEQFINRAPTQWTMFHPIWSGQLFALN
jgi:phosphatidylinositol dimannoside acyltransferase